MALTSAMCFFIFERDQQSILNNSGKPMNGNEYKLDRTYVTKMSFEEAGDPVTYWLDKTPDERLNAACFLINQLYGVTPQTKVDRTITDCRKFSGK